MSPDRELQQYFRALPFKIKKELATKIREQADRVAAAIKDAAPLGETGHLKDSVRVRRGRNTLELVVEAGGSLTTRDQPRSTGYQREVAIGQGDTQNIARGSQGVTYDYAMAVEFGTSKMPARPFFYSTWRAMEPDVRREIEAAVAEALS